MNTRAARQIAEALFVDEHGHLPAPVELDALETDLADFVRESGAWSALLLGACLWVVRLLLPFFARRLGSLGSFDVETRRVALHRMEESDLSLPFLAVKAALCLIHYEHPAAAARIGFDGQCLSGRERR